MTATPPAVYGSLTKVFHWLTTALILAIIPLGLVANKLPFETSAELAFKAQVFSWHKTLGVAVFLVALLRILWAITQAKPGPLHPERKAETFLAETVHWLLYGSLVIAPLTGWIHHAATAGFAPIWWPFGQNLPLVPKDEGIAHVFGSLHWVLTKVMAASILLHIAGALKHQFVDRDATLGRMWFGRRDIAAVPAHRAPAAAPLAAIVIFAAASAGAVAMSGGDHDGPEAAALAEVQSGWVVQDGGTMAITITQLGSEVTGTFADWTADITFDADAGPDFGDVTAQIAIGSLTLGSVTDQAMGPDYFDATAFPTATFAGPITSDGGATYRVDGELELKGVTAPVTLLFDLQDQGDGSGLIQGSAVIDRMTFDIGAGQNDEGTLGFEVILNLDFVARPAE
ncbi:cytochrome b/b6 domain-containing protein [Yoonia sp. R2331]|uniref:cytochrome b/b6 domain-containing protein n=1 Tax=Yoonia sp. R2331 TaxID=3237238 RepID=UPI0034E3CD4A